MNRKIALWRVLSASLVSTALGTGACSSSSSPQAGPGGACPGHVSDTVISLSCVPAVPPLITTTGPCVASDGDGGADISLGLSGGGQISVPNDGQEIVVAGNGEGTCQVQLRFANGDTTSVDVNFASMWYPLGTDPQGCGEGFVAVTSDGGGCIGCQLELPQAVCGGTADSGS